MIGTRWMSLLLGSVIAAGVFSGRTWAAEETRARTPRKTIGEPAQAAPTEARPGTNTPSREPRAAGAARRDDKERQRSEWQKRRDEWEKLPPEEQRAKLKEWRQQTGLTNQVSPADRELWRARLKERLERQLAEFREKKTNGTLTATEQQRLDRLEELARRMARDKRVTAPGSDHPTPEDPGKSSGARRSPLKPKTP